MHGPLVRKRWNRAVKRKLEKGYITEEEAETQFIHNPPSSSSKVEEPAPKATAVADTSFTNVATRIAYICLPSSENSRIPFSEAGRNALKWSDAACFLVARCARRDAEYEDVRSQCR